MIVGAVVGALIGAVFAVAVGSLSRAVAPQPIQASFLGWVLLCAVLGAVPGAAVGAFLHWLFR